MWATEWSKLSSASNRPPRLAVAWYRRLSVRLAGLVAITLVGFDFIIPHVSAWVFNALGVHLDDVILVDEGAAPLPLNASNPVSEDEIEILADVALEGALRGDDGGWTPLPHQLEVLAREFTVREQPFLWLDPDHRVLAASPGVPWTVGDRYDFDLGFRESETELFFPCPIPIVREDHFAGWLVLVAVSTLGTDFGWAPPGEFFGTTEISGEDPEDFLPPEFIAFAERMDRIARGVSWGTSALLAILLGVIISRWVTARLTLLATRAGQPIEAEDSVAELERVRGRDEIGVLAVAMDASATRVRGLLKTLETRDAQRREWIAQVSHDLRTPLTALMACLERARRELEGPTSAARLQALRDIMTVASQDADRVQVLAEDLLDVARLDFDDALHLEPVLLAELVERAVQELSPLGTNRGIEILASTPREVAAIEADGSRLLRVVENLLRNALHSARREVTVRLLVDAHGATIQVQDDGPGFDGGPGEVDLEGLGGDGSRGPRRGLGLAVVRRIVEAHRGELRAENLEPEGALVSFTLPAGISPD